jgi:hypothetical protein
VLARAWTELEARLKCHGRQLSEWSGLALPARCHELLLPAEFVGVVAAHALRGPAPARGPIADA